MGRDLSSHLFYLLRDDILASFEGRRDHFVVVSAVRRCFTHRRILHQRRGDGCQQVLRKDCENPK